VAYESERRGGGDACSNLSPLASRACSPARTSRRDAFGSGIAIASDAMLATAFSMTPANYYVNFHTVG
jgi:hypothetical protein